MELHASNITFGYDNSRNILQGLTFSFDSDRVTGILGPNGCGKTTLLNLLTGAKKPADGEILLDGVPISSFSAKSLACKMALVPQKSQMTFNFTALDVVLMGRQPHLKRFQSEGVDDIEIAQDAMRRLGVLELANRKISMLSGGEWQRVTIARALCQQAEILLLDEPVSNLDIRHQIDTLRLVRSLARKNHVACVCVLHDINLAANYCDLLCVLHNGSIYACGTPHEVITSQMLSDVYGIEANIAHSASGIPKIEPVYD